jgi:hypothetical protein
LGQAPSSTSYLYFIAAETVTVEGEGVTEGVSEGEGVTDAPATGELGGVVDIEGVGVTDAPAAGELGGVADTEGVGVGETAAGPQEVNPVINPFESMVNVFPELAEVVSLNINPPPL